jgi:integrase
MQESEKPQPRPRGAGSIFLNGSQVWWVGYSDHGKKVRESSHSTDRKAAEKLLAYRLAQIRVGAVIETGTVRVDELFELLLARYHRKQAKTTSTLKQRLDLHLKPFFGRRRAREVDTGTIDRYIRMREQQAAKPATINRELSALKAAFSCGREAKRVTVIPVIHMFREDNTRTGFATDQEYSRLATECGKVGLWLRAMLAVAFNYGWRLGELTRLRVRQIDVAERTIRLEPGTTKNRKGRQVVMTSEVATLLAACVSGKGPDDFVFTREAGQPVRDFRDTWHACCIRAQVSGQDGTSRYECVKCGAVTTTAKCKTCGSRKRVYRGTLFHDLRRTACRNLRRLGISETVSMKISGHRTSAIFKRYDIVSDEDIAEATARLDARAKQQNSNAGGFGQSSDIVTQNSTKSSAVSDHRQIATVLPN